VGHQLPDGDQLRDDLLGPVSRGDLGLPSPANCHWLEVRRLVDNAAVLFSLSQASALYPFEGNGCLPGFDEDGRGENRLAAAYVVSCQPQIRVVPSRAERKEMRR
jgi:hypothetical protein